MSEVHPKVLSSGAAGAITVILVYIVKEVLKVDVPPEVAAALTVLISTVAGYLTPAEPPPANPSV